MRTLFGTDGIRGHADEYPLDSATMIALGESLAHRLRRNGASPRVVIGGDTRESGPRIEQALVAGIVAGGGEAILAGVVPTPAVAWLARTTEAAAGISISASHNPWQDNGVKIFGSDGMKLPDETELEIERELLAIRRETATPNATVPAPNPDLVRRYERFLLEDVDGAIAGRHVVLDAANGAAFAIAGRLFEAAGATVTLVGDAPDGRNINRGCGALHPDGLAARVVEEGADLGVAFDGDADRAIFVDDRGRVRDGDEILYIWATDLHDRGDLPGDAIVATVMSNWGFEKRLGDRGIRLLRAPVGDKYVLERMISEGVILGGEQSGHVIDLRRHTTGDGLHTALCVTAILARLDVPFSRVSTFDRTPQVLVNQSVHSKPPLESIPGYSETLAEAERRLAGQGRVLVRYSGTENLVRVMVEGESDGTIREVAERLRALFVSTVV